MARGLSGERIEKILLLNICNEIEGVPKKSRLG
jgi:hypothetical protein